MTVVGRHSLTVGGDAEVPHQRVAVHEELPAPAPAKEAKKEAKQGRRLEVLDGLRLVAALMVVLVHYTFYAPTAWGKPADQVFPHVSHVTGYGWLGVELFFLISGFVICMSAWGRTVSQFFVSRVVRLFPAYLFAVLATAFVASTLGSTRNTPCLDGCVDGHQVPSALDTLLNLSMFQQPLGIASVDGVYWTLWEELHFYLLFALVVWRGLTYRRAVTFCIVWTVASVLVASSHEPLFHTLVGDTYSPFFVAGIALFLVYRFGPNVLLWAIVGVSLVIGLRRLVPLTTAMQQTGPMSPTGARLVVVAIFVVMSLVALRKLNWIRGRWLTVAGALTYPLYLLHQKIGYVVIYRLHRHLPSWVLVVSLVAAMLLFAWLVHRIVERPVAPLMRRRLNDAFKQIRRGDAAADVPTRTEPTREGVAEQTLDGSDGRARDFAH